MENVFLNSMTFHDQGAPWLNRQPQKITSGRGSVVNPLIICC